MKDEGQVNTTTPPPKKRNESAPLEERRPDDLLEEGVVGLAHRQRLGGLVVGVVLFLVEKEGIG